MELKEAVTILKTIDVCDLRELCDVTEEMYDEAICEVLEALEELQKENEKLREDSSLDEANIRADAMLAWDKHWQNKIKDKIEELEENLKDFEQTDNTGRFSREKSRDYDKKEVLEELLKGE